jgi:hypothetical protein
MDLVSFIPGVGPTSAFSPGATTPPPFNVSHTGLTDGSSPSTASNNMAEIYNRILLNLASVIVKAGLTPDHNNWAQLATGVETIANNVLSGFTSTIVTPPQFDDSTKIATTQFVHRALGNTAGVIGISGSPFSVSAAYAGYTLVVLDGGGVVNIDPTGMKNGSVLSIIAHPTSNTTLVLQGGAQYRPIEMFPGATSYLLRARSQIQLVWDGTYFYPLQGGAANIRTLTGGDFGYMRLENGVMLQWGVDGTGIGETSRSVSFNTTFSSSAMSVMLVGKNLSSIVNNNIPQLVSMSSSSFTYFNQGIAEPTQPITDNHGVYWFAIGPA